MDLRSKKPEQPKKVHPVALQASFDLNCPRPEIGYLKIGDDQWGVVGCGRRARYKKLCRDRYAGRGPLGTKFKAECTWVLDSPVMSNQGEAQPASVPGESL
jgi:hypothetical protein